MTTVLLAIGVIGVLAVAFRLATSAYWLLVMMNPRD
jgi:hypothetical protein